MDTLGDEFLRVISHLKKGAVFKILVEPKDSPVLWEKLQDLGIFPGILPNADKVISGGFVIDLDRRVWRNLTEDDDFWDNIMQTRTLEYVLGIEDVEAELVFLELKGD